MNHLRSTSTYTSYFLLLFFVTKYYKSVVYVGGDSVKSDQTYIITYQRGYIATKFREQITLHENSINFRANILFPLGVSFSVARYICVCVCAGMCLCVHVCAFCGHGCVFVCVDALFVRARSEKKNCALVE